MLGRVHAESARQAAAARARAIKKSNALRTRKRAATRMGRLRSELNAQRERAALIETRKSSAARSHVSLDPARCPLYPPLAAEVSCGGTAVVVVVVVVVAGGRRAARVDRQQEKRRTSAPPSRRRAAKTTRRRRARPRPRPRVVPPARSLMTDRDARPLSLSPHPARARGAACAAAGRRGGAEWWIVGRRIVERRRRERRRREQQACGVSHEPAERGRERAQGDSR